MSELIWSLFGGVIIGIAASLMLLLNGRVVGVSGIVGGLFKRKPGDISWRTAFILGLVSGGAGLALFHPEAFANELDRGLPVLIISGLLVGYGTALGGGCTSGHGICGVSRMSPRSVIATVVFMLFGVVSATLFRVYTGVS